MYVTQKETPLACPAAANGGVSAPAMCLSAMAGSYRHDSNGQGRHGGRDTAPVGRIPADNSQNRNHERIGNADSK